MGEPVITELGIMGKIGIWYNGIRYNGIRYNKAGIRYNGIGYNGIGYNMKQESGITLK